MIKLVHILRELVEAKAIEVPDTEMDKVDKLYDEIDRKFDELSKEAPQDSRNPLIRSEFRNYFTITPIGQKMIGVSIGLYNDPGDYAGGRGIKARDMDLKIDLSKKYILINLANFKAHNKQQFENLIRHELIHAIDPKTSQKHLYSKEAAAVKYAYDAPFAGLGEEGVTGPRRFPLSIPLHDPVSGDAVNQEKHFGIINSLKIPIHFLWATERRRVHS